MKTKENVYIILLGKSKEELTEVFYLLKDNGEEIFRNNLESFISNHFKDKGNLFLEFSKNEWIGSKNNEHKQEITIQELKEMLQPTLTMRCLNQQLKEAQAEVNRIADLIEENNPKVGDWVKSKETNVFFKVTSERISELKYTHVKITNQTLIKLLENEI